MTKIPECLSDLAVEELFKEDMRDYLLDDGVIDDAEKADLLDKYVDGLSYQGGEIDTPEEIDEKIVFYQNQHTIFKKQIKTNLTNPSTQLNIFANQSLYSQNDTYFVAQINAKVQRDIGYRSSSSTDNEQLVDFNPKILKRTITLPNGFLDFTKMDSPFLYFHEETKLKEFLKEMGLLLKEAQQKTGSLLSLFHNVKLNGDWLRFFVKQLAKFQGYSWFHAYFGPDPGNFKGVNLSGQDLPMNERTFANIDLSYADLTGANLAGVILTGVNLSYANLAGVNFSYAQLSGVNLTGADLTGVNFSYAQLSDLFFIGRHLTDADLQMAHRTAGYISDLPDERFKEIDFSYAVFDNVVLSGLNLDGIDFTGAKLRDTKLIGVHLEKAILVGADLRDASLQYVNLQDAKLMGADLRNANLQYVSLPSADLTGANLSGVSFIQTVNLIGAKLNGAKLVGANLQAGLFPMVELMGADLSGTNLTGADLSVADLTGANLSGANLTGADLQNADFTDAWLKDADLTNAKNADLIGADFIRLDCSPDSLLEAYFPPTHFFDFDPNAILGPDSDD